MLAFLLKHRHRFDMRGLRKHIHNAEVGEPIAAVANNFTISYQAGRLAGYINDNSGPESRNDLYYFECSRSWRVQQYLVVSLLHPASIRIRLGQIGDKIIAIIDIVL